MWQHIELCSYRMHEIIGELAIYLAISHGGIFNPCLWYSLMV